MEEEKKKKHYCPICNKFFFSKQILNKHLTSKSHIEKIK